jgi:hypothetical protein
MEGMKRLDRHQRHMLYLQTRFGLVLNCAVLMIGSALGAKDEYLPGSTQLEMQYGLLYCPSAI